MARKRANGSGSIYRRKVKGKPDRWEAALMLPDGTRKTFSRQTYAEVRALLTDAQRQLDEGRQLLTDKQTTGQFLEWWLTNVVKARVRETTHRAYTYRIGRHVLPYVGNVPLARLTSQHVVSMLNAIQKNGGSAVDQRFARLLLSMALKKATLYRLVPFNVVSAVDAPVYEAKQPNVPTTAQARAILEAAEGTKDLALWTLALTLGLRAGEIGALRWRDIDFDGEMLHVRQSLAITTPGPVFVPPKTSAGQRSLPIPPVLLQALQHHREGYLQDLASGDGWQRHDLVFTSRTGAPLYSQSLRDRLKVLCIRAGIPVFTVHELRHFFATQLAEEGVQPKTAMVLLGHANIKTTLQIYTRAREEGKRSAVEAMDRRLDRLRDVG